MLYLCLGGPKHVSFTAQVGKCELARREWLARAQGGQGIECKLEGVKDADV